MLWQTQAFCLKTRPRQSRWSAVDFAYLSVFPSWSDPCNMYSVLAGHHLAGFVGLDVELHACDLHNAKQSWTQSAACSPPWWTRKLANHDAPSSRPQGAISPDSGMKLIHRLFAETNCSGTPILNILPKKSSGGGIRFAHVYKDKHAKELVSCDSYPPRICNQTVGAVYSNGGDSLLEN